MEELFFFRWNFDVTVMKQHHTPDHNDLLSYFGQVTTTHGPTRTFMSGTQPPWGVCDGGPTLEYVHVVRATVFVSRVSAMKRFFFQFTPFTDGAAVPARAVCRPHIAAQQISLADAKSLLCCWWKPGRGSSFTAGTVSSLLWKQHSDKLCHRSP